MTNHKLTNALTLSDVLDLKVLVMNKMNIIQAPTRSGKTYAALHKMSELRGTKSMIYLIDTSAGKENILNSYEQVEEYDKTVIDKVLKDDVEIIEPVAKIMTYAKFGYAIKSGLLNLSTVGLIVCDELQSLISYMEWAEERLKNAFPFALELERKEFLIKGDLSHIAFNTIVKILDNTEQKTYVVALSATPSAITSQIDNYIMVNLKANLRELEATHTKEYPSIDDIPYLISKHGKTLIYIPHIKSMENIRNKIKSMGIQCECLWSINAKEKLNEKQYKIRNYVLSKGNLPPDVQVLIINAAYQTSININDETIDTVIIHSSDEDEQIQARGRVRHDVEFYYRFDRNSNIIRPIPNEYLDCTLTKKDKNSIAKYLNITDSNGQLRKFPYIMEHLDKNTYAINNKRGKCTIKKI